MYYRKKYKKGGLLGDIGMTLVDSTLGVATSAVTGGKNMSELTGYEYNGKDLGKFVNTMSDVTGKAAPIVATAVGGPMAGAALSGLQTMGGAATGHIESSDSYITESPEAQMVLNSAAQMGSMLPMLAYGGMMPNGKGTTSYEGLPHELGGIPIGDNVEVEGGEFKYKDMVFSNRLYA